MGPVSNWRDTHVAWLFFYLSTGRRGRSSERANGMDTFLFVTNFLDKRDGGPTTFFLFFSTHTGSNYELPALNPILIVHWLCPLLYGTQEVIINSLQLNVVDARAPTLTVSLPPPSLCAQSYICDYLHRHPPPYTITQCITCRRRLDEPVSWYHSAESKNVSLVWRTTAYVWRWN